MRSMIDVTMQEILSLTWPTLLISIVLVVTIRISYLLKHKEEFVFYKEILYLLFMLYILCVFQLVTARDINTTDGNNLILFREILRYDFGSRLFFRNIVGNVLLFVPYGFFASLYTKMKNPFKAFVIVFIASLSIELTQLSIGRVFDVDDILLNVIGGMIGYIVYFVLSKISDIFPFIKSEKVLNVLILIIIFLSISLFVWR